MVTSRHQPFQYDLYELSSRDVLPVVMKGKFSFEEADALARAWNRWHIDADKATPVSVSNEMHLEAM